MIRAHEDLCTQCARESELIDIANPPVSFNDPASVTLNLRFKHVISLEDVLNVYRTVQHDTTTSPVYFDTAAILDQKRTSQDAQQSIQDSLDDIVSTLDIGICQVDMPAVVRDFGVLVIE